jgi:hypothetical protein
MNMITDFFQQLLDDGHVRLRSSQVAPETELESAVSLLIDCEMRQREHLPGEPPDPDRAGLTWAAAMLDRAAQLAVFRELGEDEIARLAAPDDAVHDMSADVVYSVDLVFCHLPDLVRIVRAMNPDDPLLALLISWCRRWPFSSVGVDGVGEIDIEPILGDRCLALMYADRILESEDASRLTHPGIAEIVRGSIGAWTDLSPKLATAYDADSWPRRECQKPPRHFENCSNDEITK